MSTAAEDVPVWHPSVWYRHPEYRVQWYCNLITSFSHLTWDIYFGRSHLMYTLQNRYSYNAQLKHGFGLPIEKRPENFDHRQGPRPSFRKPKGFSYQNDVLKVRVRKIHILHKEAMWWDSKCLIQGGTDMLPVLHHQRNSRAALWSYFNIQMYSLKTWNSPNESRVKYEDTDWDILQEYTRNGSYLAHLNHKFGGWRLLTEQIVIHEGLMNGILTQGRPLSYTANQVSLYNSLFKAFDTETIICGATITYLPILMLVLILVQQWSGTIKKVFFHCLNALAMFLGHTDYHWNEFFVPLLRKTRTTLSAVSVATLAVLTLLMSFLYCEVFSIDLLTDLLDQPIDWMESLDDVISRQQEFGLQMVSYGNKFLTITNEWDQQNSSLSKAWREFIAEKEISISNERMMMAHLGKPQTVIQTGTFSCDSVKMWDPLWHIRNYKCLYELSSTQRRLVIINPLMKPKKRKLLRRIYRGYVEGDLVRRMDKQFQRTYQMSTMAPHQFESHEMTDKLASLGLMSMSTILVNFACLLGGALGVQLIILADARWQISAAILDWLTSYWHMMMTS